VYAGVGLVTDACDPQSLAEFGWALFQQWRSAGEPAAHGWALDALGWLGDDDTVRRLAPLIRAWPGDGGHARAVAGLGVLAAIGTDVALRHLFGISARVAFKALREQARQKVTDVAAGLRLRPEQLADRLIPDLGLDADGSRTLDYGPRRFLVGFDEQLRPFVADQDGTRRKELPRPAAEDDPVLAAASYRQFAAQTKEARAVAAEQTRRLEQAMVDGRRWSATEFRELFVAHPLVGRIVRRLVWASYDGAGVPVGALRVTADRGFANLRGEVTGHDPAAVVGVAHPLHLGADLAGWSQLLAEHGIVQPFRQLDREVYALTDAERAATNLDRFTGRVVPTRKVLGLSRTGSWQRGAHLNPAAQTSMDRPVAGDRTVLVDLDPGITAGEDERSPAQTLVAIRLVTDLGGQRAGQHALPFGDLDPVTASELLRDLTVLTD
jgi:hypothetical protein